MASPMHGAGGSAIDALVDEIQDMMAQTPDTPPLQAASPPLPPLPPPRAIDTTRRPSEPVRRPMVRRSSDASMVNEVLRGAAARAHGESMRRPSTASTLSEAARRRPLPRTPSVASIASTASRMRTFESPPSLLPQTNAEEPGEVLGEALGEAPATGGVDGPTPRSEAWRPTQQRHGAQGLRREAVQLCKEAQGLRLEAQQLRHETPEEACLSPATTWSHDAGASTSDAGASTSDTGASTSDAPAMMRHASIDSLRRRPLPVPDEPLPPPAYGSAEPRLFAETLLTSSVVDLSCLSQVAQLLSCAMPRRPLIKGSIMYPLAFTGRAVVAALTDMLLEYAAASGAFGMREPSFARHMRLIALAAAQSLHTQLFIHEADWEMHPLTDGVSEVYMLSNDTASADKDGHPHVSVPGLSGPLFVPREPSSVALTPSAAVACASAPAADLPSGVLSPLTRCYSPLCALTAGPCYAPSCPRMGRTWRGRVPETSESPVRSTAWAWVETVPRELVESLSKQEVKRQNAIYELVQKEEGFLRDLQLLERFAQRLRAERGPDAPLHGEAREQFVADVFGQVPELERHITAFVDALHERQREEHPVVVTVGDVCVNAVLEWGTAYTAYVAHYPAALDRLKRDIATNVRLARFVDECRRDPAAQRHPLDNFLFRPPARLQRYHLHLESIVKYTPAESEDRERLQLALEMIDEQCRASQALVDDLEARLQVRDMARLLAPKRPEAYVDLKLDAPERRLVHEGRVLRRPDAFEFEWTEMVALLFDHYLVLCKHKRDDHGVSRLVYSRRPIPLECLDATGFDDEPIVRSSLQRHLIPGNTPELFAFSVRHRYAAREATALAVTTASARDAWRGAIQRAVTARTSCRGVLARRSLSGQHFPATAAPSEVYALVRDTPWTMPEVTCAVPFTLADGTALVAIGTSEGVWIGRYAQPHTLLKVLHLRGVTQCAMLDALGRFIVLADRTLIAYDIEALVPSRGGAPSAPPMKLSGTRDVQFFALGALDGRPLLVYAKRKATETSLRILEPVLGSSSVLTGFRVWKKVYVYPEATSVQFLARSLIVCTPRTINTFGLDASVLEPLPAAKYELPPVLARQVDGARPLAAFQVATDTLLLCFDRCTCYTTLAGEPRLDVPTWSWEAPAARVACVGSLVVACNSAFVEVREALTGRLVQVLPGRDMRLVSRYSGASELALSVAPAPIIVERVRGERIRDVQKVVELTRVDT